MMNEEEESSSQDSTTITETESDDSEGETNSDNEDNADAINCENNLVTFTGGTKSRYANVALYLTDVASSAQPVYGLINRHVSIHADKAYIKQLNEERTRLLGTTIDTEKTCDASIDADLIKIDKSLSNQVINKENPDQKVYIYNDPFKSLFGKKVFKYRPNKGHFEVCSFDTPRTGTIASEEEHEDFMLLSGQRKGQFLVKNEGSAFSVEGESGTCLAVETSQNDIQLTGIICGGFDGKGLGYTVCQFLPYILRYFEDKYGMTLQIYDRCYRGKAVPSGIKIFFICSTPEQIAPLNFDLVDRVQYFLCLKYEKIDIENYERLLERENALSFLVSDRESLHSLSAFENETAEFVACKKGLEACDFLYKGSAKKAEPCLKEAILCVPKLNCLGPRMLCKLTTYITWFCLTSNTKKLFRDLKKLLDEAIETFKDDYMDQTGFPQEALGYMYYDYSRYYMCKFDSLRRKYPRQKHLEEEKRQKAVKKACQSVDIFLQDHEMKNSKETLTRLVLARCQQAYALLGCGHDFNVNSDDISSDELAQAKDIIGSMRRQVVDTPLVRNVDYLIALIDFKYRKGCTEDAFKTATDCLAKSEEKKYCTGYHRTRNRLQKLKQLCQVPDSYA